jgi:hypothetical protein
MGAGLLCWSKPHRRDLTSSNIYRYEAGEGGVISKYYFLSGGKVFTGKRADTINQMEESRRRQAACIVY